VEDLMDIRWMSVYTVRRCLKAGGPKGVQVKRQWLTTESDLQAFIEESHYPHGKEGK